MKTNKLRMITLALSLVLIASAFVVGCTTTQQRPTTDRYGTRYYMNNDKYTTRYGTNYGYGVTDNNTPYTTRYGTNYGYGTTNNTPYGYTPNNNSNRLYGFLDTGDIRRRIGYNNVPQGTTLTPSATANNSAQVKRMENSCENISGVKDATVVKRGNTAYIGVDKTTGTNKNTAALRSECANKIKGVDPTVNRVVVTVDPSKITKLKNMVKNINNGKTTTNFMTDLENLFR